MLIYVSNDQDDMEISISAVENVVQSILKFLSVKTDEMSVCFVDSSTICNLHAEHFDDPSFTDCITFPIDDEKDTVGYHILGEVMICPKAAIKHAEERGGDTYDELLLYLVHGICHLTGFDDLNDEDRLKMRSEEARILNHLKQERIDLRPK
jgi:probable rRNA maturation factor